MWRKNRGAANAREAAGREEVNRYEERGTWLSAPFCAKDYFHEKRGSGYLFTVMLYCFQKGKILFADSYENYTDQVILSMKAYRGSDLIRNMYINFDTPAELTIEEVLPIVATYMLYDIMDWYKWTKSGKMMKLQIADEKTVRGAYECNV